jgi:hypothetical protein
MIRLAAESSIDLIFPEAAPLVPAADMSSKTKHLAAENRRERRTKITNKKLVECFDWPRLDCGQAYKSCMYDVSWLCAVARFQNATSVNVWLDKTIFELEKQQEQSGVLFFGSQALQINILGAIRILNRSNHHQPPHACKLKPDKTAAQKI